MNLIYSTPTLTVTVGVTVTGSAPTVTGTVTSYSVTPALPAGLSLNTSTGVITGTPTAATPTASYVITATNAGGSTTATLQITVNPAAPTSLAYPQSTIAATVGQAVTTDTPTVTGTVSSYSIAPTLPAGLTLSSTTGTISGTPTAAAASATYTVTATNAGGTAKATLQISVTLTPPKNLVYPVALISGTITQAIPVDTPSFTGVVSGFTIIPALPAGITLNATTGSISGTPTASIGQTPYTVTASNDAGSTTATVQIAVASATSTSLTYHQVTNAELVGVEIAPIVPFVTVSGTYSVSPALPAGLVMDGNTGIITGTPTAATPLTSYDVTVITPSGSNAAALTIAVNALPTLLDLGHVNEVGTVRLVNSNMFSEDVSGHWVLWNYATGAQIKSGDVTLPTWDFGPVLWPADMADNTIAIGLSNSLELRSATDGHLIHVIASPAIDGITDNGRNSVLTKSWWKLSTDGGYVCAGYSGGLFAWSASTGQLLFSKTGDYSSVRPFAAPGQIQVALGPAGNNVIETLPITGAVSTTTPAFSGGFSGWFADGGRFITTAGTSVSVYSAAGVQQGASVSLPDMLGVSGEGQWIMTGSVSNPGTLNFYPIGSAVAATSLTDVGVIQTAAPGSLTLGLVNATSLMTVDLSGSSIVTHSFVLPTGNFDSASPLTTQEVLNKGGPDFAATSPEQFVNGTTLNQIVDGASLAGTPRYFGLGSPQAIAGGANRAAIALNTGEILYFDPAVSTPEGTINFFATKLAMSSDGTMLAAGNTGPDCAGTGELNIYSLPLQSVVLSTPAPAIAACGTSLVDFSLSGSGTTLSQALLQGALTSSAQQAISVGAVESGPTVFSITIPYTASQVQTGPWIDLDPAVLSPDGTLVAISNNLTVGGEGAVAAPSISIYKNGTLVATIPGEATVWLDNNTLLANTYNLLSMTAGHVYEFYEYINTTVYSASGTPVSSFMLPQLEHEFAVLPVSSTSLYVSAFNSVISTTDGSTLWSTPFMNSTLGAVAGSQIVFQIGSRIVVATP